MEMVVVVVGRDDALVEYIVPFEFIVNHFFSNIDPIRTRWFCFL